MSVTDLDRQHLVRACELARSVRKPPKKLGLRVEPVWAALLASGEKVLGSAAYAPGSAQDAIAPLLGLQGSTLYLTLEPKAGFDRLPPVTETIRRLGVKRVVLGMLDPAGRFRGEGKQTLERLGVEVVVADGEEARLAQQILDDYTKWLRGVAVLRARVELATGADGSVEMKVAEGAQGSPADAVLCSAGRAVKVEGPWLVVLDPEGWERPAGKKILYQPESAPLVPGTRRLSFRGGQPDLGALLRDLASLGILSVELCGDADLFRQALAAGLIDSVQASFPNAAEGAWAVSHISKVRLAGDTLELRLGDARLQGARNLEGRVELC